MTDTSNPSPDPAAEPIPAEADPAASEPVAEPAPVVDPAPESPASQGPADPETAVPESPASMGPAAANPDPVEPGTQDVVSDPTADGSGEMPTPAELSAEHLDGPLPEVTPSQEPVEPNTEPTPVPAPPETPLVDETPVGEVAPVNQDPVVVDGTVNDEPVPSPLPAPPHDSASDMEDVGSPELVPPANPDPMGAIPQDVVSNEDGDGVQRGIDVPGGIPPVSDPDAVISDPIADAVPNPSPAVDSPAVSDTDWDAPAPDPTLPLSDPDEFVDDSPWTHPTVPSEPVDAPVSANQPRPMNGPKCRFMVGDGGFVFPGTELILTPGTVVELDYSWPEVVEHYQVGNLTAVDHNNVEINIDVEIDRHAQG